MTVQRFAKSGERNVDSYVGQIPGTPYTVQDIQRLRHSGKTISIICDDTEGKAKRFRDLLSDEHQIVVAAIGSSLGEISEDLEKYTPDVVVATMAILAHADFYALKLIKRKHPNIHVVCSRARPDSETIRDLFAHNVDAILGNEAKTGEYSVAIRAVGFGGFYVSRDIALAMDFSETPLADLSQDTAPLQDPAEVGEGEANTYGLSRREIEVLHLVAKGLSSKQIAPIIGISARTVEAHRANIRRKTNAIGLSDLVAISMKFQL